MGRLSLAEALVLISVAIVSFALMLEAFYADPLWVSLAFSGISFVLSFCLIRWLGKNFIRVGLHGTDRAKLKQPVLPESMGSISAVVFLLSTLTFIPIPFFQHIVGGVDPKLLASVPATGRFLHQFPLNKLASYLSALLSVQSIVILGLFDDLFDMRWRHKLLIPLISSIPMLIVYFVDYGVTSIVVPVPLRQLLNLDAIFDLGLAYYLYMSLFTVFCTNSINILAGINGIEVLQSLVISLLIMCNDYLYLWPVPCPITGLPIPHPAEDAHRLSLYLLLPFTGVSLALFWHNKYPAKVFVGDTYCYFSGTVFAVVGILGHFSKTLWLLFVPQAFNFIYSSPQLFGLVPCPRHRLPRFNPRSNLLEPSTFTLDGEQPNGSSVIPLVHYGLKVLAKLNLVRIKLDREDRVVEASNLTLINLWLVWRGPMRENRLTWELGSLQLLSGTVGLLLRHRLSTMIFGGDIS